ncbi:hypothetical protein Fmac_020595 [Flemingia macrophylla]|uniref:RING-type domain-containing protein n=1 Tax=Flemingia macrophylla TaxID=520843 RepID=A0ABD1LV15_9FABA
MDYSIKQRNGKKSCFNSNMRCSFQFMKTVVLKFSFLDSKILQQKMGLSSLPAPSEGVICVLLVNTALSISIFKSIVRTILHIVGIRVASDISQNPPEFHLTPSEALIEEFRSRTPTLRFGCKQTQHDCSVCLNKFQPESEINRLSCGHLFHKVCLEKWLDYWNITCPLCRTPFMPQHHTSYF